MAEEKPKSRARTIALWALRIGGTAAGFGYIAWTTDFAEAGEAIARISPWAFSGAAAMTVVSLVIATFRWRLLLSAYGAPHQPSVLFLMRVYWIGFFYNTCLPGGVGGDVVRGVVARESFGENGTAASMLVVLVERVLGLSGLLIVVSVTYLIRPLPGTEGVLPFSGLLLLGAAAGVGGLAMSRRIAPMLPGRLGKIAASLPTIQRGLPFFGGLVLSLGTQASVAVTGWFLLDSVSGGTVTLGDAFVLVPLAMASAFFPFSVGGAGVREGVLVALCSAALDMPRADAFAVSVLIFLAQLAIAVPGGIVQLVAPVRAKAAT